MTSFRPPAWSLPADIQVRAVAALIFTADGRYLIQKRDDRAGVRMRGHWGLFGGAIESGEDVDTSLRRELNEELDLEPREIAWFTDLIYSLHQVGRRLHQKHYFEVPIQEEDVDGFTLREGEAFALMTPRELFVEPRVVPWDAYAVLMHSRRQVIFAHY